MFTMVMEHKIFFIQIKKYYIFLHTNTLIFLELVQVMRKDLSCLKGSTKSPRTMTTSPIAKAKSPKAKRGWVSKKVRSAAKKAGKSIVSACAEVTAGMSHGLSIAATHIPGPAAHVSRHTHSHHPRMA